MGRLDDIIRRNKHPKRFGERLTVGIGLALFLLLILFLMVFTDLGKRPDDQPPPKDDRVRDIKLYRPPAGSSK